MPPLKDAGNPRREAFVHYSAWKALKTIGNPEMGGTENFPAGKALWDVSENELFVVLILAARYRLLELEVPGYCFAKRRFRIAR